MTHEEALLLLDAYVDGELDAAATLDFDRHVADCAVCAARLKARSGLVQAVRSAGLAYRTPELLRRRIEREVAGRAGRQPAIRPWLPAALAASLVLVMGGFYAGGEHVRAGAAAADFANAHVRALLVGHDVDVQSSDHHVVKPWFAGKLDFSPPAPELVTSGYSLVGGRVDLAADRRVAALVYHHGPHIATVFLWPHASAPSGSVSEREVNGYRVLRGAVGDLDCVFVTDMSADEASKFRAAWLAAAVG